MISPVNAARYVANLFVRAAPYLAVVAVVCVIAKKAFDFLFQRPDGRGGSGGSSSTLQGRVIVLPPGEGGNIGERSADLRDERRDLTDHQDEGHNEVVIGAGSPVEMDETGEEEASDEVLDSDDDDGEITPVLTGSPRISQKRYEPLLNLQVQGLLQGFGTEAMVSAFGPRVSVAGMLYGANEDNFSFNLPSQPPMSQNKRQWTCLQVQFIFWVIATVESRREEMLRKLIGACQRGNYPIIIGDLFKEAVFASQYSFVHGIRLYARLYQLILEESQSEKRPSLEKAVVHLVNSHKGSFEGMKAWARSAQLHEKVASPPIGVTEAQTILSKISRKVVVRSPWVLNA